jgi:hypothetical protein
MSEPPIELELEVEDELTLTDLMAIDPLNLTKETRKPIIEFYRTNRAKFLSGGKVDKVPKPKSKGPLPPIDLDLGDLEL